MNTTAPDWLSIHEGTAPLLLSIPHAGSDLQFIESRLVSPWLARKDADWCLPELYDFASELGATIVCTQVSRTVIDVNRDPSGQSLYPGMATTELCPTTTFDGEALYLEGAAPLAAQVEARRQRYFEPYHAELHAQIKRLRALHPHIVVYDCHSIRSHIPRLFDGELPQFNIGTNSGQSCDARLAAAIEQTCAASGLSHVVNGRFKGGYITRSLGRPAEGVHAVQMELACRGYLREPQVLSTANWPPTFDLQFATPLRTVLRAVLEDCLHFASPPTR